ncbi:MAG: DUF4357 domain-containing protein [bacterium]
MNLRDIKFLTSFIGCNIFEIIEEKEKHLFYLKGRGADAKGFYGVGGFTVLKRSIISNNSTHSLSWQKRDGKVRECTIAENGKLYLEKDTTFSSPSTASAFCIGNNTNGWIVWKDKDGKTLDDVYRESL